MMRRAFTIIIMIIAVCGLFAAEKDSTATRKYYRLDGIRVIAKEPQESIGTITVKSLNKENIAGEINFYDTMKGVTGVAVTIGAKGESNLRIRAFQKKDVKIMVDGRTLNGGYFGNVNLQEIPLFDVEEVQMVKGPVSSLYGFNSMGGAVNYITKKPSSDDWLKLSTVVKRNNTHNTKAVLAHDFQNWDFWVNYSYNHTDGFMLSKDFVPTPFENGKVRNYDNNSSWDLQSKVNMTVFDYQTIGLTMGYTRADVKNVPNSIHESKVRQFTDWARYNASLLAAWTHTADIESSHRAYYDGFDNRYHEYRDQSMSYDSQNSWVESYAIGYEGKVKMNYLEHHFANIMVKTERQYYYRTDIAGYQDGLENATYTNSIGFFNMSQLTNILEVSGGFGISHSIRDVIGEKTINTPAYFDFSAGATVRDVFFDKIVMGVSKNVQYPTMRHLFSNSRGNLDLDPENAYKYEMSFLNTFDFIRPISLTNTIFYNHVYDMIERKGARYENYLEVKNWGWETALMLNIYKNADLEFNYGYIDLSMNKDYPYYEVPENQVTCILHYRLPFDVRMKYQFDYYDTRISPDDNDREFTLDAYSLHQISFSKSFGKNRVVLGLENIFDVDYADEYGFPAAGRNFNLGIEMVLF
ncbi:MAG TPA: TonB-dependent receptor plug domain-containing protein [Candidatus Cloacimonadota bacterium]|nr:TonB-dependent receptor plug domain-containing protein [Candidatus Cloacimonadota bacterium]